MLHVHCGNTSAETLRRSRVPGDVVVWSDVLYEGPTPPGTAPERWRVVRAAVLAEASGGQLPQEQVLAHLEEQDRALASCAAHEEVVLWFDACMFDQLILARQLDYFSNLCRKPVKTSLICVGDFPHVPSFRGLGDLLPEHMEPLFNARHELTDEELALGRNAWAAIRSPVPTVIEDLIAAGTWALPFLGGALGRFLEEYPSVRNGLGRLDQHILAAVASGRDDLIALFRDVSRREERPFAGDTNVWAHAERLAAGAQPLLTITGPGPLPLREPVVDAARWRLELTPAGRDVLAGKQDRVALEGIDVWLGGTHLHGRDAQWRWDAAAGKLVERAQETSENA